jgi:uncharacterized protein YnzC (UPF0291/DUF896 family)
MERAKIDRINELGRLAKERELTDEEKAEREALRAEYIAFFRSQLRAESPKKEDNAN